MYSSRSWSGKVGKHVFLIGTLACAAQDGWAQTPAGRSAPGTAISNRAQFSYLIDGETRRGSSNTVTLIVAERLDVGVSGGTMPTPIGTTPTTVTATVANMGSGNEALSVSVQPSSGVRVDQVAIDRDGDGRFDPKVDQPLSGTTPVLASGETLPLVAVIAASGVPVDGTLVIAAAAETGAGAVDRVFPGMGDDGGDAVVGRTGAAASVALPLVASLPAPTLAKRQSVRAPDGSDRPVSGAVVTYTLIATLPAGSARDARVEDPVPAGTRYVAGSLTLDGAPLSDAADGDAGDCDGRLVAVALGQLAASTTRAVTFQVRLP